MSQTYIIRIHNPDDKPEIAATLSSHGTVSYFSGIPKLIEWHGPDNAEDWIMNIPGVRSVTRDKEQSFELFNTHILAQGMAEGTGMPGIVWSGQKPGNRSFISSRDLLSPGLAAVFDYDPTVGEGDGTNVNFYIVDSGVESTHPEFTGRYGSRLYDSHPGEPMWFHGTSCAAIGVGANLGVALGATLYDSRCFPNGTSTTTTALINGMNAAITHYQGQANPGVMSCSFGGEGSDPYGATVDAAVDAGLIVVAAAGNSDRNLNAGTDVWPAEDPDVITVGSIDYQSRRLLFSNYGNAVDIYARAEWTVARPAPELGYSGTLATRGTSYSCPLVAGMVARMLTGTVKTTDRAGVEANRQTFMDTYTVTDVLDTLGNPLQVNGEQAPRLWIPGVSFTGFQTFTPPTRGVPASTPLNVDQFTTHVISGKAPTGVSIQTYLTHVIIVE